MRILFMTQIFPPEMGALPNRLYPIVRQLVAEATRLRWRPGCQTIRAASCFPNTTASARCVRM